MPGARHGVAFDEPLGERASFMRTAIVDGVKRAVDVEGGNFAAADQDGYSRSGAMSPTRATRRNSTDKGRVIRAPGGTPC